MVRREQSAPLERDLRAVGDLGVGGRRQHVMRAGLQAGEDSAPSTDPARVVTWRCSPSTVMVTCLASEAAVPPPTASSPMVAAAATSTTLRRSPAGRSAAWVAGGCVVAVGRRVPVLDCYRYLLVRSGRHSRLSLAGVAVGIGVWSASPTLSGRSFTSHPMGSLVPGRGQGRPRDAGWRAPFHIGKAPFRARGSRSADPDLLLDCLPCVDPGGVISIPATITKQ